MRPSSRFRNVENLFKRSKTNNQLYKNNKMNINTSNPIIYKALLYMLFLSFSFQLFAQNKKEVIRIQNEKISLKEAFNQIEEQTNYTIAYELSELNLKREITLNLQDVKVEDGLNEILKDTNYTFRITGYHIIIFPLAKENQVSTKKENVLTQVVRGVVIHSKTNIPIAYASVTIQEYPNLGAVTDSLGQFTINHVPVGRCNVQTSLIGYTPNITKEVLVTSSKEVYLVIQINENIHNLDEVIVRPELNKSQLINSTVLTGGRMVSMEEANRFANGFDDPARMVSAFAGVAGSVGTNAIAIRGNAPQFTQWRLEGIEIPNPTHFADLSGLGGGFLSALSTQVMGNFDFYNGAFNAEYNNALSGVLDMHIRNGNNQKHEHTFQLGLLGIDLASEGPLSKKHRSSYIFNYRFSTTSLATNGDINMKYQDLSFKLNFPTKKLGTFSIWGLGLIDKDEHKEEEKRESWETLSDRQSGKTNLEKLAGGLSHKYLINPNTYLQSSLAATYSHDQTKVNQRTLEETVIPVGDIQNSQWNIVFSSYLNKRFSSKHMNRTGIRVTGLFYDLDYKVSPMIGLNHPMERVSKGDGSSSVFSAYSTSTIDFNPYLSASVGLTSQYFSLNKNWSLEPRVSLKWKLKPQHALSLAYGLHSRIERLDYYFVEQAFNGKKESNKYLDLSKAHHFGLSYDWTISPIHHLRIEPYYQSLYHIPVEKGSSFSIINQQDIYLDRILENNGAGKNYGVDITFEQYMKKGFYYMLTGSLFKSKYKGGDNIWRNTRYDRGFSFNLVAGKEWMVGKQKQHILGINGRLFFQGGDRYTPIDIEKSNQLHEIEFDESKAFSKKFNPAINGDISINYKINKRKLSHEFSIKLLNVGFYTGSHFYQYDEKTHTIKKEKGMGLIPNISYKIYF